MGLKHNKWTANLKHFDLWLSPVSSSVTLQPFDTAFSCRTKHRIQCAFPPSSLIYLQFQLRHTCVSLRHIKYSSMVKWNWPSSFIWVQICAIAGWWNTLATLRTPTPLCTAWLHKPLSLHQSLQLETGQIQPIRKHTWNHTNLSEGSASDSPLAGLLHLQHMLYFYLFFGFFLDLTPLQPSSKNNVDMDTVVTLRFT